METAPQVDLVIQAPSEPSGPILCVDCGKEVEGVINICYACSENRLNAQTALDTRNAPDSVQQHGRTSARQPTARPTGAS